MFNFSKRQNTKHHVHNFTIKGTHAFDVDINHLSYRFASYSCSSDYLQTITVEIVNPFSENKKKEFVYLFTSDDQEEFSLLCRMCRKEELWYKMAYEPFYFFRSKDKRIWNKLVDYTYVEGRKKIVELRKKKEKRIEMEHFEKKILDKCADMMHEILTKKLGDKK